MPTAPIQCASASAGGVLAPPGARSGAVRLRLAPLAVCFSLLLARHYDCLWTIPTGDQASGLWLEGIFLHETRFDYARLRFQEQTPAQGGASVYVHSVLPTLIALLYDVAPSPAWAFFAYHVFTIFCAAVVVWLLYESAAPVASGPTAALAAAFLATWPPFALQVSLLGMEIPMTALASLAAVLAARERYPAAAAAAFGACAMKITALLATGVLMAAVALLALHRLRTRDRAGAVRAAAGAVAFLIVVGAWSAIQSTWRMSHLDFRMVFTPAP